MFNLVVTILVQSMQPTFCVAVLPTETIVVKCECSFTAKNLKSQTCVSDEAPNAELKEVQRECRK